MSRLPAFAFQTNTTTVLDELTNFGNKIDALDDLIGDDDEQTLEEGLDASETFGDDTFGDLQEDNLPSFFATPKKSAPPSAVSTPAPAPSKSMLSTPQRQQNIQGLTSGVKNMSVLSSPPPGIARQAPPPGLPSSTPGSVNRAPPNTPATRSYAALLTPAVASTPAPTPAKLATPQEFMRLVEREEAASSATAVAVAASISALATPIGAEKIEEKPRNPVFDINVQPSFATLTGAEALNKPFPVQAAAISGKPDFGRGKLMSASNVRYVVEKVLQPLESSDPYSDDFYFLQYNIKKNLKEREQATKEQRAPPPPLHVPLPAWKDTKERIKAQMDLTRKAFEDKVKEWEEKEQVLGHRIRPGVSKPREQLSLPSVNDMEFDDDDDVGGKRFRNLNAINIVFIYCLHSFPNRWRVENPFLQSFVDDAFGCPTRI
jgi:hypothetical protein